MIMWAIFVSIHDSRHCMQCMLACLGPLTWRGPERGVGGGVASAGQRTVTSADWSSSLIILPLLPASPHLSNKLKLSAPSSLHRFSGSEFLPRSSGHSIHTTLVEVI
ncbi:hypothetical protein ElyMa_001721700 [Elysia marginata]|uniref:Secreted protein n=1 Tax=Elysia marginata TaxID=1093978 RepID=A0AAV4JV18_9GAST|nr:hypothetical protein ElyMa_001721700 [Elysia marginata]